MAKRKTAEEIQAEYDEMERLEKIRIMGVIDLCMRAIATDYQPANVNNADDHITTQQFIQSIQGHVGESIPTPYMYEYLVDHGYKFARTGSSTDLKWLLKKI